MSDGPRIPAIPTLYNGVEYRSRLEARWAAFFGLAGWQFQYEPFDLNGWIPDFMICGDAEILVEVKPVTRFPLEVHEEVQRSGCDHQVLFLGCAVPVKRVYGEENPDWGPLGWLSIPRAVDPFVTDAYCLRLSLDDHPAFGLCGNQGPSSDRITGKPCPPECWHWASDEANDLWTQAGNLTQWKGRRSVTDARPRQ